MQAFRSAPSLSRTLLRSSAVRAAGVWANVPQGPADAILGLTVAFNADTDPNKVSLGVGAYRDDAGKPFVLESVRQAEKKILEKTMNMEYAGIDGVPEYTKLAQELAFGEGHPLVNDGLVASTQSISGTGALRICSEFVARFGPGGKGAKVYIPTPSWANHVPIIKDCGLEPVGYRHVNKERNGLDFDGLIEDVMAAPDNSVFMFHACAHNPTGIDPTMEQWKAISDACKTKNHVIWFDSAYQGFASGDPALDSASYQMFLKEGHQIMLCQSFAKNMGLYGQRVGCFHVTCTTEAEQKAVMSQLKLIVRPMYSNPPIYGARLVAEVLKDPALNKLWREEVKLMADRINTMRGALVAELKALGSTKDWSHITSQIGMFCYTGLSKEQVDTMREQNHVYMTADGRMSVAGLTSSNIKFVAEGMHAVTK